MATALKNIRMSIIDGQNRQHRKTEKTIEIQPIRPTEVCGKVYSYLVNFYFQNGCRECICNIGKYKRHLPIGNKTSVKPIRCQA